jgi:hypothetical protein
LQDGGGGTPLPPPPQDEVSSISDGGGEGAAASHLRGSSGFSREALDSSCCVLQPGDEVTHITWSDFEKTQEAALNVSQGLPLVVPCGYQVTMDQSPSRRLAGLEVRGDLRLRDGTDIRIETGFVFVCGNFSVGSPTERHQSKVEIVLTGDTSVHWPSPTGEAMDFGRVGFVTYGGHTSIRGSSCDTATWARLAKPIEIGADSDGGVLHVVADKPLVWRRGDTLVITSRIGGELQTDEVRVESVEGRTITFSGAITSRHTVCEEEQGGGAALACEMAAEVASLERNIVIRGESGCEDIEANDLEHPMCGHFMMMNTGKGEVCGVEFTNLGQRSLEGRYPLQVRLPGYASSLLVQDNSLHHNYNHGIVVHGSQELSLASNLCYMTQEARPSYSRSRPWGRGALWATQAACSTPTRTWWSKTNG